MARKRRTRKKMNLTPIVIVVVIVAIAALLYLSWSRQRPFVDLDEIIQPTTTTAVTVSNGWTKVQLYYYNRLSKNDNGLSAVERALKPTLTPLKDTIRLLISGQLTWQEKNAGFQTEFPHPDFKLLKVKNRDGVVTLEFSEVPGFTSGGASRVGLLAAQIKKTALQFPGVKEVRFEPEYLFQP
jgi:spore germination protein GerM